MCVGVCERERADRVTQSSMILQLLLLLCQRNQGASVITVVSGQPYRLQNSGPLGQGAPQLLLPSTEPFQAVAVWTNRRQR